VPTLSQLQGYDYRFEKGTDESGPVLLLLHGTGGNEHDLIPVGRLVAPEAHLVSPRGNVSENGALRFFRRLAEGVFDMEDLAQRTGDLLRFLDAAATRHGFTTDRVIALGFSNGANIAASMMLTDPARLRHGILLRSMVPFEPKTVPDMKGSSALIAAGRTDRMIPGPQTERLAELMRSAGARVELKWYDAGHTLTSADVNDARNYVKAWPLVTL
jgi:phospholipase/carboxylesterase